MPQLLVRDLSEHVVRALKLRAAASGRSAEAEHRAILEQALLPGGESFWDEARRLQSETAGAGGPDGTDIIRRFRDERSAGGV